MAEAKKADDVLPEKKRIGKKKVLLSGCGAIVFISLIVFFFVNGYINKSLPATEGIVELSILDNEVTVITDRDGVPHIQAQNAHDLYIAQGYIQADRRMFQMELS